MSQTMETRADFQSPVDNPTYNLITTLGEKLQALETYRKYAQDMSGSEADLYRQLIEEDTRQAERIYDALRERIRNS